MICRHLKRTGFSYCSLKSWRFIICTPEKPGCQKLGESQKNKQNFKKIGKKHKLKNNAPLIKNLLDSKFVLVLIILLVGLSLKGELFLTVSKAQAASNLEENLNLAKTVIDNVSSGIFLAPIQEATSDSLTPDGFLSKPLVVETQVTKEESVVRTANIKRKTAINSNKVLKISDEVVANRFPYGYCTYYVAQKRFIPWSGNAISWLANARAYGYETGSTPRVGAIIATNEGGATGHVGMVDAVDDDQITVSEMNYRGFGVISSRTISASYSRILGYIY